MDSVLRTVDRPFIKKHYEIRKDSVPPQTGQRDEYGFSTEESGRLLHRARQ